MRLLLILTHIVPVPSSLFYWFINCHLQDILHNTTLLLKPNLELSHTETGNHAFIIGMVPLTVHLLKYCDSVHCGFLVFANAVFASLLHPRWLKDVPGALL